MRAIGGAREDEEHAGHPVIVGRAMSEAETPTLAITEQALERVKSFVAGAPDPESQAMWVEVTGVSGGEYTYNMTLKPRSGAAEGDAVQEQDGLTIVVPGRDV